MIELAVMDPFRRRVAIIEHLYDSAIIRVETQRIFALGNDHRVTHVLVSFAASIAAATTSFMSCPVVNVIRPVVQPQSAQRTITTSPSCLTYKSNSWHFGQSGNFVFMAPDTRSSLI